MPIIQLSTYATLAPTEILIGETVQSCRLASLQRGLRIKIGLLTFPDNLSIFPNDQLLSLQDDYFSFLKSSALTFLNLL